MSSSFKKCCSGIFVVVVMMSNIAHAMAYVTHTHKNSSTQTVLVSWYGKEFHRKQMACGKRFNMYDSRIVAHKTLPCGTRVTITNLENGVTIHATVQDRGPQPEERIFDLSYRAAEKLGIIEQGIAMVQISIQH